MKVANTGAAGLLGQGLVHVFQQRHEVFPLTRAEMDITDPRHVHKIVARLRPELVVHATATPGLDTRERNPARGCLTNVYGRRHWVETAQEVGAALAYISTDAVFDGGKSSPYFESVLPIRLTVYGRT